MVYVCLFNPPHVNKFTSCILCAQEFAELVIVAPPTTATTATTEEPSLTWWDYFIIVLGCTTAGLAPVVIVIAVSQSGQTQWCIVPVWYQYTRYTTHVMA